MGGCKEEGEERRDEGGAEGADWRHGGCFSADLMEVAAMNSVEKGSEK